MKKARIGFTPTTQLQSESVQEQERYIYTLCMQHTRLVLLYHFIAKFHMNNTEDANYYSGLQVGLNFFLFGVIRYNTDVLMII